MKKEDIHLDDIYRLLIGNASPEFLLETFIRTLIVYVAALTAIRILGKRMGGQLTITELAVIVFLGAIISVPAQVPMRGILPGLLILLLIVVYQRSITWLSCKSAAVEQLLLGKTTVLIKDGVLQLDNMKSAAISHQQVYGILRSKNVYNLGRVKRLYLEDCGLFSLYEHEPDKGKSGLSVLPPSDPDVLKSQEEEADMLACNNCGYVTTGLGYNVCPNCSKLRFEPALKN